jgi:hypothetical protein
MGDTSASTNGWGWRHGRYGSERAARATGAVPKPSIVSSRPHKALGFDQRARSLQRVKIDVEGYELNVLRGSEEFVRRNRPTIFGEFSPSWYAARGVSIRQSGNNLTFAASASTIGLPAIWRCDVAYVYHPPMTAALAAAILRSLRGVPFVLHVQDMWPDLVTSSGFVPPGRAQRGVASALGKLCNVIYQSPRPTLL